MELTTTRDPETWTAWCDELELQDTYYTLEYAGIWEEEEGAEAVGIKFDAGEQGTLLYPVMKDPLDYVPGGEGFHDLRTPYDFGGPTAFGSEPKAVQDAFVDAQQELVEQWNVVTEFARLHPYQVTTPPEDAEFHADNIQADLTDGYEQVWDDYHTNQRNRVRSAKDDGVTIELEEGPEPKDDANVRAFLDHYYGTMVKVGANPNYFYLPETLQALMNHPSVVLASAYHEDNNIASGMFLCAGDVIFYFLSGSDQDYLDLRPNNLMLDRIVEYGCDQGFARFHLGGGSEGLRHFKSQVGNDRVPYHILNRVHDEEAYEELIEQADLEDDGGQFPAYRLAKFDDRGMPPSY